MQSLPAELIFDIYLHLNPSDLVDLCQSNVSMLHVGRNEYLWLYYIKRKYFIDRIPATKTGVEVALMAEDILEVLFEHELYPTFRVLDNVINDLTGNEIYMKIGNRTDQQLISVDNFYDTEYPQLFQPVDVGECGNVHYDNIGNHIVLEPTFKRYFHRISNLVNVPTVYLVPTGTVVINFDADMCNFLICDNSLTKDNHDVNEYVYDNFSVYCRILFVQYFGNYSGKP